MRRSANVAIVSVSVRGNALEQTEWTETGSAPASERYPGNGIARTRTRVERINKQRAIQTGASKSCTRVLTAAVLVHRYGADSILTSNQGVVAEAQMTAFHWRYALGRDGLSYSPYYSLHHGG